MAVTPSVKVVKTMTFKGVVHRWSNRYHFNGGTPADATHWHTLMDNVVAAEKLPLASICQIVECIGYNAGSDLPVASKTYSQNGLFTLAGSDLWMPGDAAYLQRWETTARTRKNHPVYLFSYYHGVRRNSAGDINEVQTTQVSAFNTYGSAWVTGFSDGAITAVRAGPNGATGFFNGRSSPVYATHRDFPS